MKFKPDLATLTLQGGSSNLMASQKPTETGAFVILEGAAQDTAGAKCLWRPAAAPQLPCDWCVKPKLLKITSERF